MSVLPAMTWHDGLGGALADGRMVGQVVQPEVPGLLSNLAHGRIPVLVQRFEIAKDTSNFFASNTKFLGVHKFSIPGVSRLGWARRGPRITTTSRHSQVSRTRTQKAGISCGQKQKRRKEQDDRRGYEKKEKVRARLSL